MRYGPLLLLLWMAGCGPAFNAAELHGRWQAGTVVEEGVPLQIDPTAVGFEFAAPGSYVYRSTLNYREAGRYRIEDDLLVTTDTTQAGAVAKRVQILQLTPDSLYLGMNDAGKARTMYLYRVK